VKGLNEHISGKGTIYRVGISRLQNGF